MHSRPSPIIFTAVHTWIVAVSINYFMIMVFSRRWLWTVADGRGWSWTYDLLGFKFQIKFDAIYIIFRNFRNSAHIDMWIVAVSINYFMIMVFGCRRLWTS